MNYKNNPFTNEELKEWADNRLINPRTKRKIKQDGPTFKLLKKEYEKVEIDSLIINSDNNYELFRKYKIDPFTFERVDEKKAFKFPYKWNPYTGERLEELDENGPLYFDAYNLAYYYYTNRLNNLFIDYEDSHYYGDAVGNGPNFIIKGRGCYKEWYLFRLPIQDCYLNENCTTQYVSMGPILTFDELIEIDKINKTRLLETMHMYYSIAISKTPYLGFEKFLEKFLDEEDLLKKRQVKNRTAVIQLKHIPTKLFY